MLTRNCDNGNVLKPAFIVLVLLAITSFANSAGPSKLVESTQKKVDTNPIVIQTQVQSYDKPTMKEYEECYTNRETCQRVCETASNRTACESECPICPVLINQFVLVQGVNDTTNYRDLNIAPINTTNLIQLTSYIRNVIDNKLGNITTRNENNIQIHLNMSTTGGRFGLGYNNIGPCCYLVHETKPHMKRHRECGDHCRSAYMYEKPTTRCQGTTCSQSIEYLPYIKKAHRPANCRQSRQWPFVSCSSQQSLCARCSRMPISTLWQNNSPCGRCFNGGMLQPMPYYPPMYPYYPQQQWAPPIQEDFDDDLTEFQTGNNEGWQLEKKKCRRVDGSIIDNCLEDNDNMYSGSGSTPLITTRDPFEDVPDTDYDSFEEEISGVPLQRRRRNNRRAFKRSAYSQRYLRD